MAARNLAGGGCENRQRRSEREVFAEKGEKKGGKRAFPFFPAFLSPINSLLLPRAPFPSETLIFTGPRLCGSAVYTR